MEVSSVPRITLGSDHSFESIVSAGAPVVIEGLDLGSCVDTWNMDYLVNRLGEKLKVRSRQSRVRSFKQDQGST